MQVIVKQSPVPYQFNREVTYPVYGNNRWKKSLAFIFDEEGNAVFLSEVLWEEVSQKDKLSKED